MTKLSDKEEAEEEATEAKRQDESAAQFSWELCWYDIMSDNFVTQKTLFGTLVI